jgi:hypothetical protein
MTAKPIFVVRLPRRYFQSEPKTYMQALDDLRATLTDYHVLITSDTDLDNTKFECYNAANATEADLQAIQDIVLKKIEDEENSFDNSATSK